MVLPSKPLAQLSFMIRNYSLQIGQINTQIKEIIALLPQKYKNGFWDIFN